MALVRGAINSRSEVNMLLEGGGSQINVVYNWQAGSKKGVFAAVPQRGAMPILVV